MIKYILRQFKNSNSSINNKWLAYPVIDETVGLDELSEHMSNHNTPFSAGAIKGMLTDMIGCIKEILLQGKNVKLPDLAIFSIGIKNHKGAESEEEFNTTQHIKGVKLRARATGTLTPTTLNLDATLKRATTIVAKKKGDAADKNTEGSETSEDTQSATV